MSLMNILWEIMKLAMEKWNFVKLKLGVSKSLECRILHQIPPAVRAPRVARCATRFASRTPLHRFLPTGMPYAFRELSDWIRERSNWIAEHSNWIRELSNWIRELFYSITEISNSIRGLSIYVQLESAIIHLKRSVIELESSLIQLMSSLIRQTRLQYGKMME